MDVNFDESTPECKIGAKKAIEGSFVLKDAVLFEYKRPDGTIGKVKAPCSGVIAYQKEVKRGAVLSHDQLVAKVSDCTHAIVIKDMCATCGRDLREKGGRAGERKEKTVANVSMIHHVPELIVSDTIAHELGSQDETHLLETHKLVLLVDLDQTVIHTSNRPVSEEILKTDGVTQYNLMGQMYTTKLRPYTENFFDRVSKMYEMHIVTYGQRMYAHRIAQILDPEQKYFGQRILSRDELFSAHHKTRNLKAIFPCGERMIAIIDDRADVWQYSPALIQVKPYRFFKEVGDINAPADSPEAKEAKFAKVTDIDPEGETDAILEEVERVLTNVHTRFYEKYQNSPAGSDLVDIKKVMTDIRSEVLEGCYVVFSGVMPHGVKPESTDIYKLIVQFGAIVTDSVNEETTHVIATRWGTTDPAARGGLLAAGSDTFQLRSAQYVMGPNSVTSKVHEAVKNGIYVVTTKWVYACIEHWMKMDEKLYELSESTQHDPPPAKTPRKAKYPPRTSEAPPPPPSPPITAELISIGKTEFDDMTSEVDAALSDEDDDDDGDEDENVDDDNYGDGDDDDILDDDGQVIGKATDAGSSSSGRGVKRAHAPEEEYESDSEQNDDDEDGSGVMSYKALVKSSRRTGRLLSINADDEDTIASVDDLRLVNRTGHVGDGAQQRRENDEEEEGDEDDHGLDVSSSDEDKMDDEEDEYDELAAMVEREISES